MGQPAWSHADIMDTATPEIWNLGGMTRRWIWGVASIVWGYLRGPNSMWEDGDWLEAGRDESGDQDAITPISTVCPV